MITPSAHQSELLRAPIVELSAVSGFREHFYPETGPAYGLENFSWTAVLLIDLLHDNQFP